MGLWWVWLQKQAVNQGELMQMCEACEVVPHDSLKQLLRNKSGHWTSARCLMNTIGSGGASNFCPSCANMGYKCQAVVFGSTSQY